MLINCTEHFAGTLHQKHEHMKKHEKSFRNLIKSNRNQIVFALIRIIWNQTDENAIPCPHNMLINPTEHFAGTSSKARGQDKYIAALPSTFHTQREFFSKS